MKSADSAPEYGFGSFESPFVNDVSVPPLADAVLGDAEHLLLAPSGLDQKALSRVLADMHTHDIDFADL